MKFWVTETLSERELLKILVTVIGWFQERRQKNFQEWGNGKKDREIAILSFF